MGKELNEVGVRGIRSQFCAWVCEDEETNVWYTTCGNAEQFNVGNIQDNHYRFCPYCGGKIVEPTDGVLLDAGVQNVSQHVNALESHAWTARMLAMLIYLAQEAPHTAKERLDYVRSVAELCQGKAEIKAEIVAWLDGLPKQGSLRYYHTYPALMWFLGEELAIEVHTALELLELTYPNDTTLLERISKLEQNPLACQVKIAQLTLELSKLKNSHQDNDAELVKVYQHALSMLQA